MQTEITITPSLFYQYLTSPHWIWYDLHGDPTKKAELSELTKKLIEDGLIHEEECIKDLKLCCIESHLNEEEATAQTLLLMQQGAELIYQGVISCKQENITYKGRPDLLKKAPGKSSLGDYYYFPIEIKSANKCKNIEYQMQLMFYAMILEKIQNHMPDYACFINKNKSEIICELTSNLAAKTQETIQAISEILYGKEPSLKISSTTKDSPWFNYLLEEARSKQDISLIYKLRFESLEELRKLGIKTLSDFLNTDIKSLPKIKQASIDTLEKAQLQAKSLINNEIIQLKNPKIPQAKNKIYFDIEGDPFLNIDYLFGFWISEEKKAPYFKYFIAEKPEDEKTMWENFLSWLKENNFNDYKIYHYHHYEKTHLNSLSKKYGDSDELNDFIKNLVDLSTIIEKSYIFPIYFYSIKDIAKHLNFKWQHSKSGGAQSIFWYEQWLETADRNILQDILNYNEDDVRATEFLHGWLIARI